MHISNEWGYRKKFVEQCYLTNGFLDVSDMKVEWNGSCVL